MIEFVVFKSLQRLRPVTETFKVNQFGTNKISLNLPASALQFCCPNFKKVRAFCLFQFHFHYSRNDHTLREQLVWSKNSSSFSSRPNIVNKHAKNGNSFLFFECVWECARACAGKLSLLRRTNQGKLIYRELALKKVNKIFLPTSST